MLSLLQESDSKGTQSGIYRDPFWPEGLARWGEADQGATPFMGSFWLPKVQGLHRLPSTDPTAALRHPTTPPNHKNWPSTWALQHCPPAALTPRPRDQASCLPQPGTAGPGKAPPIPSPLFVRAPCSPNSCPGPQGPPQSSQLPLPVLPLIVPCLHPSRALATPKCHRCHPGCSFCNDAIHFPPLHPPQPPTKCQHLFHVST